MNIPPSPVSGFGSILAWIGGLGCIAAGVKELSAIPSIAGGAAVFVLAYICMRLPQIRGLLERDGFKVIQLFVIQFFLFALVAGFNFGIGRGVAALFF